MRSVSLVMGILVLAAVALPGAGAAAETGGGLGDDEPSTVFDFMWDQGAGAEPVRVGGLGMSIENLSEMDLTVSVTLVCHGLINSHSSLDLGSHRIGAREVLDLWAPADALPIRSARMVSQVRAEITALIHTPYGTFEQSDVSAEIYYRHFPGFQEMLIFSMRGLIDRYEGRIGPRIRCTRPADCREIVLGQVADTTAPGGFRPVTAWDASLLKRDPRGRVMLRLIGSRAVEEWEPRPWPPTCDILGSWLDGGDAVPWDPPFEVEALGWYDAVAAVLGEETSEEEEDWVGDDEALPDVFLDDISEVSIDQWPWSGLTGDAWASDWTEEWWPSADQDAPPPPPPLPSPDSPTGNLSFCMTWQSQYVDAGQGEDVFYSTALKYRKARYARASVSRVVDDYWYGEYIETIWEGTLGSSGCTPVLEVYSTAESPQTWYRIKLGTLIERDVDMELLLPRRIYLMPEGAAEFDDPEETPPEPHYQWFQTDVETGPFGGFYYAWTTIETQWHNWHTNLGPIAGRILHKQTMLNFPLCNEVFVRQRSAGSHAHPTGNICIWYDPDDGKDRSAWKFATTHEFGHSNAARTVGAYHYPANYVADDPDHDDPPPMCKCEHVVSSSQLHCLQSREYIREAENEGYAQAWSAATYNYRNEDDSWFTYYKEMRVPDYGILPYIDLYPPDETAIDLADNVTWMETHCPVGYDDRGTEWDWMVFFRRVWAVGDDRFSFKKLSEIWEATDDAEKKWESLLETVDILYDGDSTKYWHFYDTGGWAGVNH